MMKHTLTFFFLILLILSLGCTGQSLEINSPAPVSNENIEIALAEDKVVVLQFTADWCPSCQEQTPVVEEVCSEYSDEVTLVKIDFDSEKQAVKDYGVASIPRTIIVDKNGNVSSILVGITGKARLEKEIKELF